MATALSLTASYESSSGAAGAAPATSLFLIHALPGDGTVDTVRATVLSQGFALAALDVAERTDKSLAIAAEICSGALSLAALDALIRAIPGVLGVAIAPVGVGRQVDDNAQSTKVLP